MVYNFNHRHPMATPIAQPPLGPPPADMFVRRWQNDCNLMLHLTTKNVFENFGGSNYPVSSPGFGPDHCALDNSVKNNPLIKWQETAFLYPFSQNYRSFHPF